MTALAFLGFALVCSVLGSLYLWSRTHKPTSMEAGMAEFSRGLAALAPRTGRGDSAGPAMPRSPNVEWSRHPGADGDAAGPDDGDRSVEGRTRQAHRAQGASDGA